MFLRFMMAAFLLCLVSCAQDSTSDDNQVIPTIYYKPTFTTVAAKCSASEATPLLSTQGKPLAYLCPKDFDHCVLQGSCFIQGKDAKKVSFNVHSRQDGVIRFVKTDVERCPFGLGAGNVCLDPYFSVAADLNYYELGDVIFVPRLVGVILPTGETHDGYLVVRDKGGAIKGINRFDFFTGFLSPRDEQNIFSQLGFGDKKNRFDFRKATETETQRVRQQRAYPHLPN